MVITINKEKDKVTFYLLMSIFALTLTGILLVGANILAFILTYSGPFLILALIFALLRAVFIVKGRAVRSKNKKMKYGKLANRFGLLSKVSLYITLALVSVALILTLFDFIF
ncbi:MAG: hypothetical protein R3B60_04640 [Candidatus Paceibacterota bacterium]